MKYTREDLLKICEQAFVNTDLWHDRDSHYAQCKLGECYALLKDGCEFKVLTRGNLKTNKDTIWLEIKSTGFEWFEGGNMKIETYYLPTQKRLDEVNGEDWY